jgi:radical SAM protein with 4Fe4S-binding SPASM domain
LEQVVFETTYNCDLNCIFCYNVWKSDIYQKGAELTLNQYKTIMDKIPKANIYALSGGEPLLRRDIFEIADIMREKCRIITLLTSGIHLDESSVKKIADREIRTQLPVHGLKEQHDAIFGQMDVFKKLVKAFTYLHEYSVLYTTATVVSKKNIDQLSEILEFCVAMGSRYLLLIRFLPGGAGLMRQDLLLNRDEILRAYETLNKICGYYGVKGGVGVPNLPCIIDEKQFKNITFSSCGAGKSWFTLGPAGDFRICNHSPTVYGNILEQTLETILNNKVLLNFKHNKIFPEECAGCKLVASCRGGCRAAAETMYGDLYKPDPMFIS